MKLLIHHADGVIYEYRLVPAADELISGFLVGELDRIIFAERPPEHMRSQPIRFEVVREAGRD